MKLIDVCVNLLNSQFKPDRSDVLRRAADAGVDGLLFTATDLVTSRALPRYCTHPGYLSTAGVHPHDAAGVDADWADELSELAALDCVRAVGETGLDFNRNFSPRDAQLTVFRTQISLARQLNKTLFVHDRESGGEVLHALLDAGDLPAVVIHCFTGTRTELKDYLDAGFYIGITGWIADKRRGDTLRELAPMIPADRLVIETDAPFLRPHNAPADAGSKARRNEPCLLPYVLNSLARARDENPAELAAATHANARRLFGFG